MPRPNRTVLVLAVLCAFLAVLLVGAGLAYLGHRLAAPIWNAEAVQNFLFPDAR